MRQRDVTTTDRADVGRGIAAYEAGDLDSAERIAKSCLRSEPEHGRAWELTGLVQFARGNVADSVRSLERATTLVPLRPAARCCLAHGYALVGRTNLACEMLSDQLAEHHQYSDLLLQIGTGLNLVGRPDLAMEACRRAIGVDVRFAQAYYELAFYAGRSGVEVAKVEGLARRAIDLEPDDPTYRIGLAGLLCQCNREDDAFDLVQDLSFEDLRSVTCVGCLERLLHLYGTAGDLRRIVICQEGLLQREANRQTNRTDCC